MNETQNTPVETAPEGLGRDKGQSESLNSLYALTVRRVVEKSIKAQEEASSKKSEAGLRAIADSEPLTGSEQQRFIDMVTSDPNPTFRSLAEAEKATAAGGNAQIPVEDLAVDTGERADESGGIDNHDEEENLEDWVKEFRQDFERNPELVNALVSTAQTPEGNSIIKEALEENPSEEKIKEIRNNLNATHEGLGDFFIDKYLPYYKKTIEANMPLEDKPEAESADEPVRPSTTPSAQTEAIAPVGSANGSLEQTRQEENNAATDETRLRTPQELLESGTTKQQELEALMRRAADPNLTPEERRDMQVEAAKLRLDLTTNVKSWKEVAGKVGKEGLRYALMLVIVTIFLELWMLKSMNFK